MSADPPLGPQRTLEAENRFTQCRGRERQSPPPSRLLPSLCSVLTRCTGGDDGVTHWPLAARLPRERRRSRVERDRMTHRLHGGNAVRGLGTVRGSGVQLARGASRCLGRGCAATPETAKHL